MKNNIPLTLLSALAVGLAVPALANETTARVESSIHEAQGEAAKLALQELDAEIDQLDAMIDNAPTAEEKAAARARIKVLKERRGELRKTWAKANYEELKADVRAEGNKFKAWTKRTFTRDPAEKAADDIRDATDDARREARRAGDQAADEARAVVRDADREVRRTGDSAYAQVNSAGAALDLAAYKARPTDTNKEEMKAAIKALEAKIDQLDDRADKMARGPARDAAKRRVKALEDRKDELENQFNKARFDALIDDVQAEWNDFRN